MIDLRVRTLISDGELSTKIGKILTLSDYNVVITGPARVRKPDGALLCVYIPQAIPERIADEAYPILHGLRNILTNNRGYAGGTPLVKRGTRKRISNMNVRSAIIGSFDPSLNHRYCRQTAWTGDHEDHMRSLVPFFQVVSEHFQAQVPDRYAVQANYARRTHPAWRIGSTPFTTVTVNNTYPTGAHTDAGDLREGFSTIVVLRRGEYSGGTLVFPRLRVGVEMGDRDLLLMDAHEWHGNTAIEVDEESNAERISVVAYYREKMASCGDPDVEHTKALRNAAERSKATPR
jgi:hypothetical protein